MQRLHDILTILLKYTPVPDAFAFTSEHDILYLDGPHPTSLDKPDWDRLEELMCHYEDDLERWMVYS